jgi:RNA polymerase sigma factor (sigma-70 family)
MVMELSDQNNNRTRARLARSSSTVMLVAANPRQLPPLRLGEECRAIEEMIRKAKFRDQVRFVSQWAARRDDLLQALNDHMPSVLHFSGHGAGDQGLCFQTEDGSVQTVTTDDLTEVIHAAGQSLMIVVLNACYAEMQAQKLAEHVPCVVGMSGVVGDDVAIAYARSFYRALASGRSAADAHKQGTTALGSPQVVGRVRDIKRAKRPQRVEIAKLLTRSDIDANHIYIVSRAATRCLVVIRMEIDDLNADLLAHMTESLRKWSGDVSLQITDIAKGSVRLTVSLSYAGRKRLIDQWASNHLIQLCGFDVTAVGLPLAERPVEANASQTSASILSALGEIRADPPAVDRTAGFEDRVRSLLTAGDTREAATLAWRELGPEVLGFLSGVLGDVDADEVFSIWGERLWKSLKGFEGRCSIRTWTYVLALREITRFRKRMRKHAEGPLSELKDVPTAARTPSRSTTATARQQQLIALRDELPIEDRMLLILRVDRKLSFDEIALAFADHPEAFIVVDRMRESARLRKRFQLIKQRLISRLRDQVRKKAAGSQ